MREKQRVTIKRVAREAGVSTQTVSRVLNNRPDVATETRLRVKDTIERLGYLPSALARSLIQQRSYTIGVVTAGLKYAGPSRTLNGIAQQAEAMGYTLLVKELPGFETEDVQPILRSLLSRQVDGILWAVPEIGHNRDWLDERLPELHEPMLFLTMHPRPGVSIVSIDNYLGGCLATRHLLEQGFRHIGHLAGPLDWWEARQRKAGWQDTLAAYGIEFSERNWVEGNWSSSSGARAIQELFDQFPEMDAVFVANDQMALSVLQAAHRRKLQVPRDLGVVGFDELPEAAYFWPPLTTIAQDQLRLGGAAVRQLVKMIENRRQATNDHPLENLIIQPQLVIRESSLAHAQSPARNGQVPAGA